MRFGRLEGVQKDHRRKIGSMPQNNCDPAPTRVNPVHCDAACPKCGVEMEPIDSAAEGLALEQLRLCPGCYLVTWIDHNQYHVRQGVAMKRGFHFGGDPEWLNVHPEEC
jgi:hypothetical protein